MSTPTSETFPPALLDLLGFPLVLLNPASESGKVPLRSKWQEERCPADLLEGWTDGVGVLLGGPEGFIDFDGDGPDAETDFERFFEGCDIPPTCSWESTRGTHRLFQATPEQQEILGKYGNPKFGQLEIRVGQKNCYRFQTVLPSASNSRKWLIRPDQVSKLTDSMVARMVEHNTQLCSHTQFAISKESNPTLPGNVYNAQASWDDILTEDGWVKVGERTDNVYDWKHPNATNTLSATVNWYGNNRLHVFTTSVDGLEAGNAYTPFEYRARTKYKGDFTACARDLVRDGYTAAPSPHDYFVASTPATLQKLTIPTDVVLLEGFVQDYAKWYMLDHPYAPDERTGAFAGICALSFLLGQKVQGPNNERPNLTTALLGPSGSGKTLAMQSLQKYLKGIGRPECCPDNFGSGQAMEDTLLRTPNFLLVAEETQDILSYMSGRKASTHIAAMATFIKQISTKSGAYHQLRQLASDKKNGDNTARIVHYPNVVPILTAIEELFWSGIGDAMLTDGFLGRLWTFNIEYAPRSERPTFEQKAERDKEKQECWDRIIAHGQKWLNEVTPTTFPNADDKNTTPTPAVPEARVIPMTEGAMDIVYSYSEETRKKIESAEHDLTAQAMWSRANEMMGKFALLIYGSSYEEPTHITGAMMAQACAIVDASIEYKLFSVHNRVVDKEFQARCDKILAHLKKETTPKVIDGASLTTGTRLVKDMYSKPLKHLFDMGEIYTDAEFHPLSDKVLTQGPLICLPQHRDALEKERELRDNQAMKAKELRRQKKIARNCLTA